MRIILSGVFLIALQWSCFAQWNSSGTNIYNTNGGSVGIGISSPAARLHVYDGGFRHGGIGEINIDAPGVIGGRLRILDNGCTGIGTPSPSQKLEVVGLGPHVTLKVRHALESVAFGISIRQNENLMGQISCEGRDFQIEPGWDKSLILGSIQMGQNGGKVLFPGGNIGIGTSNPTSKLTVNGTIHSKEVKVDLNIPAPDYVFEPDYNLPSLEEVQNYINQNKHLPEVPSAKEMEDNGINVSEMNMILLKKVEELTLYMIEIKHENNQLKAENKEIKQYLKELSLKQ